ncbi:MAG TPA: hypothetical protein VML96_04670 [Egibacteraceae bacterium]|nr:hypothetical protein [Egibacteraceae bacterium]
MQRFAFRFDRRWAPALFLLGVTPYTASVVIAGDRLRIRFGLWALDTPLANVAGATVTGPYRAIKAIGPRGSWVDRGVSYGTNAENGVCIRLHEPVASLDPFGWLLHPGVTVTVAEPEALVAALEGGSA